MPPRRTLDEFTPTRPTIAEIAARRRVEEARTARLQREADQQVIDQIVQAARAAPPEPPIEALSTSEPENLWGTVYGADPAQQVDPYVVNVRTSEPLTSDNITFYSGQSGGRISFTTPEGMSQEDQRRLAYDARRRLIAQDQPPMDWALRDDGSARAGRPSPVSRARPGTEPPVSFAFNGQKVALTLRNGIDKLQLVATTPRGTYPVTVFSLALQIPTMKLVFYRNRLPGRETTHGLQLMQRQNNGDLVVFEIKE